MKPGPDPAFYRGLAHGLLLSTVLWAIIIGAVWVSFQ